MNRHWQGTLYLEGETGWSPLPDCGHNSDEDSEDGYKQSWRSDQFVISSPNYALIDFDDNDSIFKCMPRLGGGENFFTLVGPEQEELNNYVILELDELLVLQTQTNCFDAIIDAMRSWKEINRRVVLCLNYIIF